MVVAGNSAVGNANRTLVDSGGAAGRTTTLLREDCRGTSNHFAMSQNLNLPGRYSILVA